MKTNYVYKVRQLDSGNLLAKYMAWQYFEIWNTPISFFCQKNKVVLEPDVSAMVSHTHSKYIMIDCVCMSDSIFEVFLVLSPKGVYSFIKTYKNRWFKDARGN